MTAAGKRRCGLVIYHVLAVLLFCAITNAETAGNGREISDKVLNQLEKLVPQESQGLVFAFLMTNPNVDRVLQVLETFTGNEKVFKQLVDNLVDDAQRLKTDENYSELLIQVWNTYLENNDGGEHIEQLMEDDSSYDPTKLMEIVKRRDFSVAAYAFLETVVHFPPLVQQQILRSLTSVDVVSKKFLPALESALKLRGTYGSAISVGLLAGDMAWELIENVRNWWRGEISGERCIKNIVDRAASLAGGYYGAAGGAIIGNAIVPGIGAVGGAVVGSVLTGHVAGSLSDWLTRNLFDLPKDVALENAYRFIGVTQYATSGEINSRYRQLALRHHPDKGGNKDDWNKLQFCLTVIRLARGAA